MSIFGDGLIWGSLDPSYICTCMDYSSLRLILVVNMHMDIAMHSAPALTDPELRKIRIV